MNIGEYSFIDFFRYYSINILPINCNLFHVLSEDNGKMMEKFRTIWREIENS